MCINLIGGGNWEEEEDLLLEQGGIYSVLGGMVPCSYFFFQFCILDLNKIGIKCLLRVIGFVVLVSQVICIRRFWKFQLFFSSDLTRFTQIAY